MSTQKEQLAQIILADVRELNGDNTEEELNMIISQNMAEEILKEAETKNNLVLKDCVESALEYVDDTENVEENGAWVYRDGIVGNWVFEKHKTIADAVRHALTLISARVICNGSVVKYDSFDDNTAYYIDERCDKVKIVDMNRKKVVNA